MTIELLLAKLDFDSFAKDSIPLIATSYSVSVSEEWVSFCKRLKALSTDDVSDPEKLILAKLTLTCLKNGIKEAEFDQFIRAATQIKLMFGPTIYYLIFTAKVPDSERCVSHYLKLYQVIEELKDDPEIIRLLMSFNARFIKAGASLITLIDTICMQRTREFNAKYPSRPVSEVVAAFMRVDEHLRYPLNHDELAGIEAEFTGIDAEKERLISFTLDELRTNIQSNARRLKEDPTLAQAKIQILASLRELIRRHFHIFPHDTQMMALLGILHKPESLCGRIAQIKTGEGKSTVIAILAAYMAAQGHFVDIVSSNDYLSTRDCAKYKDFFASIGITSSEICQSESKPEPKKEDFNGQVLFATVSDIKFSILRDNLYHKEHRYTAREGVLVPRTLDVVIVDEIDTLVDTALNSAYLSVKSRHDHRWVYEPILSFIKAHKVDEFADIDIQHLRDTLQEVHNGHYKDQAMAFTKTRLLKWMKNAYAALQYTQDTDYEIKNIRTLTSRGYQDVPTVLIVDHKHTGRTSKHSRWTGGLHQFVEVKHGIQPKPESNSAASLSHTSLFTGYKTILGLTGTMGGDVIRAEVREVYNVDSFDVPPHVPNRRVNLGLKVHDDTKQQFEAIYKVLNAKAVKTAGFFSFFSTSEDAESCLVLFNTIKDTIEFAKFLTAKKMPHQLLNEQQAECEDEVIKRAAFPGVITVATNMAGRGTDILARKLHVIFADFAANERVEAQGNGRSARQGKEGSCEAIVSMKSSGVLSLSPELLLRLKKSILKPDEFNAFLYETRDKRTEQESKQRKISLAIEAICYSKLEEFFRRLKSTHDDFDTAETKARLIEICEHFTPAVDETEANLSEAYATVVLYAKTLLEQKGSSASIDWMSLIKQFKALYLQELTEKWGEFYTQLSDYHHDDFIEAKAKIEADYATLQTEFALFNIDSLFRKILASTQKAPVLSTDSASPTEATVFNATELGLQKILRVEAARGNDEEVFRLLQSGVFIDAQDNTPTQKKTALHRAIENGHINTARLLLAAGASFNLEDCSGVTAIDAAMDSRLDGMNALMYEPLSGDDLKRLLSKYKTSKDTEEPSLDKALRRAAAMGCDEDVFCLIESGAVIDAQDDNPLSKKTALHLAIEKGRVSTARLLITAKASTDIKDAAGATANDYAEKTTTPGMKAFVKKTAPLGQIDRLRIKYKLSAFDSLEKMLRRAAVVGAKDDVVFLLTEGVDIDAQDKKTGSKKTALHLAVANGHELVAQILVSAGANRDKKDASKKKAEDYAKTPSMLAIFNKRSLETSFSIEDEPALSGEESPEDVVRKILTKYQTVDTQQPNLQQAFYKAVATGEIDEVMQFILAKVNLNQVNPSTKKTALHEAIANGHVTTVQLLLAAKVITTVVDGEGLSADHYLERSAVEGMQAFYRMKQPQAFQLLTKYRSTNLSSKPMDPVFRSIAALGNDEDLLLSMKLDNGTMRNAQEDVSKKTALHLAIENGHVNTARLIIAMSAATDIKDAADKTATDYLAESTIDGMKMLTKYLVKRTPTEAVNSLLDKYRTINIITPSIEEALRKIAEVGDVESLRSLLKYSDVDIDAEDNNPRSKKTALHLAVQNGHELVAELLVSAGADLNKRDYTYKKAGAYAKTPSMISLFTNSSFNMSFFEPAPDDPDDDIEKILIKYQTVDIQLPTLDQVFYQAVAKGANEEVFQLLKTKMVNINLVDPVTKKAPLHEAITNGHLTTVRLLLAAKASTSVVDGDGVSAEDYLARSSQEDMRVFNSKIRAELKSGPIVNILVKYRYSGLPAVYSLSFRKAAVTGNDGDIFLLSTFVNSLMNSQDDSKKTALHLAIENGKVNAAMILIVMGAAMDIKDSADKTAADYLAESTIEGMKTLGKPTPSTLIDALLDKYKTIKTTIPTDEEALRKIVAAGDDDSLRLLLEYSGVDINAVDKNPSSKKTLLHIAVQNNRATTAKLLIDAGARTDIEDNNGKVAADYLRASSSSEIKTIFENQKTLVY